MTSENKQKVKSEVVSWIKTFVIAAVIAVAVNAFVIVNARVPSGSMERTIMTNDRIIAFRLSYVFSEPQRGDIVVFKYPDDREILYVKRIIGLPGETVEMVDGKVFINGELFQENYLKEDPYGSYGPYTVPEDHYFMMGDNRNLSWDSRFWDNTYVDEKDILGKGIFRYYPSIKKLS